MLNIDVQQYQEKVMSFFLPCLDHFTSMLGKSLRLALPGKRNDFPSLQTDCSQTSSPSDCDQPKNYHFKDQNGGEFFIKNLDKLSSASLNVHIHNCSHGKYVLFSNLENAIIDGCSDCDIFLGPCRSTVFIRNCRNVNIRSICQQLRLQNCNNISIEGIVGVQPVLEHSSQIKMMALSCCLPIVVVQKAIEMGINISDNQIYEAFDFTPKKQPNFCNVMRQASMEQQWRSVLRELNFETGQDAIYLPYRAAIKNSLLKKTYSSAYFDKNSDISLVYGNCSEIDLLKKLSSEEARYQFELVSKINQELGVQTLRKNPSLMYSCGDWSFFLIRSSNNAFYESNKRLGLNVCRNKEILKILISEAY